MMRSEEENFQFRLPVKKVERLDNKLVSQINEVNKQVDVISRYVAMLSKRIDDALTLTRVQEEKIKDIENRIEALTARELE